MNAEIEKIIQADEAARKNVEAARKEAENIRNQAQKRANEIIAEKENEFTEFKRKEFEKIVSEAGSKAQRILEETGHYLEILLNKKSQLLSAKADSL